MKTYETFLKASYTSRDVEAETEEQAKKRFVAWLVDNLNADMIEANALDDEYEAEP